MHETSTRELRSLRARAGPTFELAVVVIAQIRAASLHRTYTRILKPVETFGSRLLSIYRSMASATEGPKCVSHWSVVEVNHWLEQEDLQYAKVASDGQDVDGRTLMDISEEDLQKCFGILSFGKRKQLLHAIVSLLRSSGELAEGGEQLVGEASPRVSAPVVSQLYGSQTEPMIVSSGITTQPEGLQSHTASRGKVQDDEVQVNKIASAAKLDFQKLVYSHVMTQLLKGLKGPTAGP